MKVFEKFFVTLLVFSSALRIEEVGSLSLPKLFENYDKHAFLDLAHPIEVHLIALLGLL
jgi:hypothetical protein